ncbi:MAG: hypothetical protein L6461_22065 [Anaerolineae bacterium]|nr:hypothetical protein [Anaerolineae bacterium]
MNIPQRFFLVFTLSLLLLGLAAHAVPSGSVCACADVSESQTGSPGLDACLVCQLQTGIQVSSVSVLSPGDEMPEVASILFLIPLEHTTQISRPPILF